MLQLITPQERLQHQKVCQGGYQDRIEFLVLDAHMLRW